MTGDTPRGIDFRVGENLGWEYLGLRPLDKHGRIDSLYRVDWSGVDPNNRVKTTVWFGEDHGFLLCYLPRFTTDPAAADLVRQEIERRGWRWWQVYRGPDFNDGLYSASVIRTHGWDEDKDRHHPAQGAFPHLALCLAFLAACDATKEPANEQH